MKDPQSLEVNGRFSLRVTLAVAVVSLALAWQGAAQVVLNSGNSTAVINPVSQTGMFNWTVDGVNQLHQQWFWYRVGAGPELSIDTISAPVVTPLGPNAATISYASALFTLSTTYTLSGGLPGSGASDIGESIVINNISSNSLAFHFFQYSDFTLGGTPGDDFTALSKSFITGLYNEAAVWDANFILTENVDTVVSPGANHGEVAPIGFTLGRLNDAAATILNDVAGPAGPSYNTWAFQWDVNIAPGDSLIISKDKNLQAALIPEPSALGLVLLGLGVFWRRMSRHAA